ncbi:unnamed protein product [Cunninghamella blakesleeana]
MSSIFSSKSSSSTSSNSFDKMLDMFLPSTSTSPPPSSSATSSFRTKYISLDEYKNDPELFIGDDSDSQYTEALMQSDMFRYLQNYQHNDLLTNDEDNNDIPLHRLRILLSHLRPSSPSSSSKDKESF